MNFIARKGVRRINVRAYVQFRGLVKVLRGMEREPEHRKSRPRGFILGRPTTLCDLEWVASWSAPPQASSSGRRRPSSIHSVSLGVAHPEQQ